MLNIIEFIKREKNLFKVFKHVFVKYHANA